MGMNIRAKQDVSYLFSSLGSGAAGVAGSNFLSDYASIKNGSYLKLMKAYYGSRGDALKAARESAKSAGKAVPLPETSEERKAYNQVQVSSDALKDAADALMATGTKSVFAKQDVTVKDQNGVETTAKEYDREKIYKAVDRFVSSYNSVIQASGKTENDNITRRTANLMGSTTANLKSLLSVGISVNKDGTLSLDKESLLGADMSTAKALFSGNGSYAYRVSAQASMVNYAADNEAARAARGSSYTASGAYGANYQNGNLFSSWL